MNEFNKVFGNAKCDHVPKEHEPVQGAETKRTESYTWDMTDMVHDAFKRHVNNKQNYSMCCSLNNSCAYHYNSYHTDLDDLSTDAGEMTEVEDLESDTEYEGDPALPVIATTVQMCSDGVAAATHSDTHRKKLAPQPVYSALVHTLLTPHQVKSDKGAQEALRAEAEKHQKGKTWLLDTVREARDVMEESRRSGIEIHMGHIFGISSIKNAELPADHPLRKYKGRIVFGGNRIRNEKGQWIIYDEIGASPATAEASRVLDALGLQPGWDVECSDADSAYTQTTLKGPVTWVRLPKWLQPESWQHMVDPVCILHKNLYGHPLAGNYWAEHCDEQVKKAGFVRACESWPSV